MDIIIIGMRGSGKTTVGAILARKLGINFYDMDSIIEKEIKKTIFSLFKDGKESQFRKIEHDLLLKLSKLSKGVLSTGGGIILNSENKTIIKENFTIWLRGDISTLLLRTQNSHRPPLTNLSQKEEYQLIQKVRKPIYDECSKQSIDTTALTPEEVAQKILSLYLPS
jgi:shikimate kinase